MVAGQAAGMSKARQVEVTERPLRGDERYDYADAFEIRAAAPSPLSAEGFARLALEASPRPIRWGLYTLLRHVIRLRLAPRSSADHVLGWPVTVSEHDVVQLEAESALIRGIIVGRRVDETLARVTTFVVYKRPLAARAMWTVASPLHRLVARRLMERAAAQQSG